MVSVRELRGGLMTTLTQCQQQVLDMLISYQKERGFPPTNQEVATMLGYRSVNA
ncbi:LexA family transcriptional regulator, partial [Escherichia coli]